ncbi:ferritin-like domain-containing protein [Sulfurimonas sp. C5]|uniref:ferritin-like domain-containing protein n=1 Tax=Sulfurimonas sp. C5 TaxID=3036947 RepID=UPI002455375C|nr:ferritin-like domain-containing protein [Sulfurimonas sp. C5]MDH4943573.1 ferritin-like domain-containing protein [Sulfurimonas sp. C5]
MDFYKELEQILELKTPKEKLKQFRTFYKKFQKEEIDFVSQEKAKLFSEPAYEGFCQVVAPQKVPKRSNLTTKEGQINLLHAVTHIEYSAIDLALDAAYRFRGLPRKFYEDWLEVADDEVRHFEMLEELLNKLGSAYGKIEVHNSLFEASYKTQTLIERMAVVPRYLEANGLDATPMILEKLKNYPKNDMLEKIKSALTIILQEEIDHVKKGDVWFSYACDLEKKDTSIFFDIIQKYYPRSFLRPDDLNIEARKEAGFSCNELKRMANKEVC